MDCPYIHHLEYRDFSLRLHQQATENRIPLSGSLELTLRCNLRCQHCYIAIGQNGLPNRQELSYPEIQRILDEMVDLGTLGGSGSGASGINERGQVVGGGETTSGEYHAFLLTR